MKKAQTRGSVSVSVSGCLMEAVGRSLVGLMKALVMSSVLSCLMGGRGASLEARMKLGG